MKYAIVVVPAAPVRKKPNHRFEMVNQLLFGEKLIILKTKKDWYKVKSTYDDYKGWVTWHMIQEVDRSIGESRSDCAVAGELLNTINVNGLSMQVPMGSFLWNDKKGKGEIGEWFFEYNGKIAEPPAGAKALKTFIEQTAKQWLNAPYLWGGKTILGVDCSGFSQTVFKAAGIVLKRDAWQQAQQGALVKRLQDAQVGDLAFFDDKDEIVHVGILLGPDKIIHSAGKVRIDTIDKKGIINGDTGKRTHQLKLIKRMVELT